MSGLMELHRAQAGLTTRMGWVQLIHPSPPTPTRARTKAKGGRRLVTAAGEGEVGDTRSAFLGGVVGAGVKVTAAVTGARVVEAEAGALLGGAGMPTRPGGRIIMRRALRELGSKQETS